MDLEAFEEVNRSPFVEGQDHSSLKLLKHTVQTWAIKEVFEFKTLWAIKMHWKWAAKVKIVVGGFMLPLLVALATSFASRSTRGSTGAQLLLTPAISKRLPGTSVNGSFLQSSNSLDTGPRILSSMYSANSASK